MLVSEPTKGRDTGKPPDRKKKRKDTYTTTTLQGNELHFDERVTGRMTNTKQHI